MLVRRPDRPQPFTAPRPAVIPSPRNPGSFEGWGPKL
jgi:hypothetical protein